MSKPIEFVILDNRPALDVLTQEYYVAIYIREVKSQYTQKYAKEITSFQPVDEYRFFLYGTRVVCGKQNSLFENRSMLRSNIPVAIPDLDYAMNDFYCLPYTMKVARNFLKNIRNLNGAKLFVCGDNGCGKTTFINTILENFRIDTTVFTGSELFEAKNDDFSTPKTPLVHRPRLILIDEFDKFLHDLDYLDDRVQKAREETKQNKNGDTEAITAKLKTCGTFFCTHKIIQYSLNLSIIFLYRKPK